MNTNDNTREGDGATYTGESADTPHGTFTSEEPAEVEGTYTDEHSTERPGEYTDEDVDVTKKARPDDPTPLP